MALVITTINTETLRVKPAFGVIRYEPGELNGNSKKVLVPMSFCKETNVWEKGSWPKDRPLFQENFLKNAADGDEVVIVEGEKAVQALTKLKNLNMLLPGLVEVMRYIKQILQH